MEPDNFDLKLKSKLYVFCENIIFIAKINIFMFVFTLMGGIIFGLFPAIFSAIQIFENYSNKNEANMFKNMWYIYKKFFIKANLLGLLIISVSIILLCDIVFFMNVNNIIISTIGYLQAFILLILSVLVFLYFPSITILQENINFKKCIYLSIILGFSKFKATGKLLLILFLTGIIGFLLPQFFVFFVLSLPPFFCYSTTKKFIQVK